ncbi:T9SS type A sorting domain-containing protein [Chryseobacterium indologenes]|nr:T9SS type A sorting domain-containing protein [Chryseobacterium indologenes]
MKNIFTFLCTVSCMAVYSQGWIQTWKIAQSERNVAAVFGFDILLKNNVLYSSATGNNTDSNGQNSIFQAGSLYVFELENNTWIQKAKIVPNDRAMVDGFGKKFAVDNNDLFISAPYKDGNLFTNQGAVYRFSKNNAGNWIQLQKIDPPAATTEGGFGSSLSAESGVLAVGSLQSDVSIFEFSNTTQQFELTQSLPFSNNGSINNPTVFIKGNKIFTGKRNAEVNGTPNAGQVNIYGKNAAGIWEIKQTIDSPVAGETEFGSNVYAKDDYLLVTAYSGLFVAVYKYNSTSDSYEYKQTINDDNTSFFGTSVSIENNTLAIGAPSSMNGTINSGSVFIYKPKTDNEWALTQKIYHSNPSSFDNFGRGVSISNGMIAAGAPHHALDPAGMNYISTAGSVYVFKDPTLSVHEAEPGTSFQLYPNPFSHSVSIQLGKLYEQLTAEVFDLSGKKIFTENFSRKQAIDLHLGFLTSGTYMVKVYSKNSTLISSKIIKK